VTDEQAGSGEISITVNLVGQQHQLIADTPNLGDGLFLAQFPIDIKPATVSTATNLLTVQIDAQNSVSTLGPWLCAKTVEVILPPIPWQARSIIYLPIVKK
jgi:hypothetical protein